MGDLAKVLFEELVNYDWPINDDGVKWAGEVADAILASSWLAERDAQVRAEGHREGVETALSDVASGAFVGGAVFEATEKFAARVRAEQAERDARIADAGKDPLAHCCDYCSVYSERFFIAEAIRASAASLAPEVSRNLEPAPEPEWEYSIEFLNQPGLYEGLVSETWARSLVRRYPEHRRLVRRRKASPWEPVPDPATQETEEKR